MANLGLSAPVMGQTAQSAQTAMTPATNLAGVYQNALGRAPDAAGLAFYQGHLDNGMGFEELRQNIWNSPEAQAYQASQQQQQPNVFDTAGGAYNQAVEMLMSGMPSVSAPTVRAGQLKDTDLSSYMNPYTEAVTDQALSDLDRSREIAMNQTNSAASGAFGGSRHGVMQAETNRNFADATARTSAGLNSANFNQAQGAAFQDIGNRLAAAQANQAAALQASMANANNHLSASNQLGNLSNLGFTLGNNALDAQMQAGGMQQGLMQAIIDAGKAQTNNATGETDAALSRLLAVLGGVPVPQTTTQKESPGIMDLMTAFI